MFILIHISYQLKTDRSTHERDAYGFVVVIAKCVIRQVSAVGLIGIMLYIGQGWSCAIMSRYVP